MSLKVNEIFYSLQGEGRRSGRPCLFIRLTGCPVRCTYCDTKYAFYEGDIMEVKEIVNKTISLIGWPQPGTNAPFVEVTGGEPLAQSDTISLLSTLVNVGYEVVLETAGSHDIGSVPCDVFKIVDRKTPDSGAGHCWLDSNLEFLIPDRDELKFVLCSRDDYYWAKDWCKTRDIFSRFNVIFSTSSDSSEIVWFADKIVKDLIHVRFQLQLHKIVWGSDKRGV